MRIHPLAILGTVLLLGAAPAVNKPASIERISMQLFYAYSGRLSANIAPPAKFDGWNTVIGEGSAEEAADDMLVRVHLQGKGESGGFGPLKIIVTNGKGKVVGQRLGAPSLADANGNAAVGLWLKNVGCAGKLTVTATMGKAVRRSSVNLDCGE